MLRQANALWSHRQRYITVVIITLMMINEWTQQRKWHIRIRIHARTAESLQKGEWMILKMTQVSCSIPHMVCVCVTLSHTLSRHHMGSLIFRFIVIVIAIIIIGHKYSMNEALYWFTRIRFLLTLPIQIVCCVGLVPIKFSYRASEQQIPASNIELLARNP